MRLSAITKEDYYQKLSYEEYTHVEQFIKHISEAMFEAKEVGDFFTVVQLSVLLPRFLTEEMIEELQKPLGEALKRLQDS